MQPHIELTIQDLTRRANQINDLVAFLRTLNVSDQTPIRLESGTAAIPRIQTTRAPSATGLRGDAQRILDIARKLPEPISTKALQQAAAIPKSSAGSTITRWLNRGWIRRIAPGEYTRNPSFGGIGAPIQSATKPSPVSNPCGVHRISALKAPKADRAKLEAQLADALKQRDHAQENGRDQIVEIFQKDIDRLQSQIDAL